MNLPNKLTIFRVILIPLFVFFLLSKPDDFIFRMIALSIFIVASLTDMLDGKIARKYNFITNFGKFADPLADKLLVCSAMICLIETGQIPSWVVIIIIAREFIISGFRLIASDKGVVIAANYFGKFKTVFQMLMVIVMVANLNIPYWTLIGNILMYIALFLTILSLVVYMYQNRKVLADEK